MRTSAFVTAAFAAFAVASPVPGEKVVTTVDVTTETLFVTVTAGQHEPTAEAAAYAAYGTTQREEVSPAYPAPEAPAPPPTTEESTPEPDNDGSAPVPSAPTGEGSPTIATTWKQAVVNSHNYARRHHGSPDLVWDDDMYKSAIILAKTCIFEHKGNILDQEYGQNLAAGGKAQDISNVILDRLYGSEIGMFGTEYGKPDPSNFNQTGHATAILWKSSVGVGCAAVTCPTIFEYIKGIKTPMSQGFDDSALTVCHYSPPGNYRGEYAQNVGRPLNGGKLTITGDDFVDKAAIEASWLAMG